jgi:DnaJ family protein A protein 2
MSASTDLYGLLGVPRNADDAAIKNAFKAAALKSHPDKGGDPEVFKQVRQAYEVLSDPGKRSMYDATGQIGDEDGGPFGGGGGGNPFGHTMDLEHLFGMFGGGMGMFFGGGQGPRGGPQQGKRSRAQFLKGPDKLETLNLNLADLYSGKKLQANIHQLRFCPDCKGEGCTRWEACSACRGQGAISRMVQVGAGMMSIQHLPCDACSSHGFSKDVACTTCSAKGLTSQQQSLIIDIQPGSCTGDRITFAGACSHDHRFKEAGDLIFELVENEHAVFQRKGNDLFMHHDIELAQALLGFTFTVPHVNGRTIKLRVNQVTGASNLLAFNGLGMPIKGRAGEYGRLIVELSIRLPPTLSPAQREHIEAAFPSVETTTEAGETKADESEKEQQQQQQEEESGKESEDGSIVGENIHDAGSQVSLDDIPSISP